MVFRPWMYLVFAIGYAICGVLSHYYIPGMVMCGAGVFLCLWMMWGARRYYGRWW